MIKKQTIDSLVIIIKELMVALSKAKKFNLNTNSIGQAKQLLTQIVFNTAILSEIIIQDLDKSPSRIHTAIYIQLQDYLKQQVSDSQSQQIYIRQIKMNLVLEKIIPQKTMIQQLLQEIYLNTQKLKSLMQFQLYKDQQIFNDQLLQDSSQNKIENYLAMQQFQEYNHFQKLLVEIDQFQSLLQSLFLINQQELLKTQTITQFYLQLFQIKQIDTQDFNQKFLGLIKLNQNTIQLEQDIFKLVGRSNVIPTADYAIEYAKLEQSDLISQQLHVQAKRLCQHQQAIIESLMSMQELNSTISIEQNSSFHIYFDGDLNCEYCYVGQLICIRGNEQAVSVVTAFLIDEHILVTCYHAFENEHKEFTVTKIIFIPNCTNSLKDFRYTAEIKKQDVFSTNAYSHLSYKEVGRELAVIILREPIKVGFQIPRLASLEQLPTSHIIIPGYPLSSVVFNFKTNCIEKEETAVIGRVILEGHYACLDPKDHKIEHNLPTKPGMSGAPIMAMVQRDGVSRLAFVGIHTHGSCLSGVNNLGFMFNPQFIQIIYNFAEQARWRLLKDSSETGDESDSPTSWSRKRDSPTEE